MFNTKDRTIKAMQKTLEYLENCSRYMNFFLRKGINFFTVITIVSYVPPHHEVFLTSLHNISLFFLYFFFREDVIEYLASSNDYYQIIVFTFRLLHLQTHSWLIIKCDIFSSSGNVKRQNRSKIPVNL